MPEGEGDGKDDGNGASYISYGITRSAIRLVADREERPSGIHHSVEGDRNPEVEIPFHVEPSEQ